MKLKKPRFWNAGKFSIWPYFLFPFTFLFFLLSSFRNIKKKKFSIPVICVGNIYLGGTGKTPLASKIFKICTLLGKKPGFIKKYYSYLNDEINMLKKIGPVFINKNRHSAIKSLIEEEKNVAILDDGFQDLSIEKSFSIICFNEKQWIGNGFLIPSGPLREKLSSLKKADCVFINGNKNLNIENKLLNENKNIKIFYSRYVPKNIKKIHNKKIIAFAGIGNPSNFFDLLKENRIQLIEEISYPDHYNYSKKELNNLIKKSKEKNAILLTTEKDYSRIHYEYKDDVNYLSIELEIENEKKFIETIKKII